jgi:hypothetical protein
MATGLIEYLNGKKVEDFVQKPIYSQNGDFLTIFFEDKDAYAHRVDELLTVYLSETDNELVGCKIKGIKQILDTLGSFSIKIKDQNQDITLGMLFLAGMAASNDPNNRDEYRKIGHRTRNIFVKKRELQPA